MLRERNCSVKPRSEQSILKAQTFAHKDSRLSVDV